MPCTQDDDKQLGLKSTALLLEDKTKPVLTGFALASGLGLAAAGMVPPSRWPPKAHFDLVYACPGYYADMALPFYAISVGGGVSHMLWQVRLVWAGAPLALGGFTASGLQIWTADFKDRWNLTNRFVSNQYLGAIVACGVVVGKLFSG